MTRTVDELMRLADEVVAAMAIECATHDGRFEVARAALRSALEEVVAMAERQQDALEKIEQWSRAYPLKVFPEPDFAKAHEALQTVGITLDAVSASDMRHVITQVQAIVDAAMQQAPEQEW